jgi:ketosteroid isomerase-like protein
MSEHPNAAIVRSAYEAMARGDMPAMAEVLDEDIIWHESTPGFEGDYRGRDQALALMGRVMQEMGVEMTGITIHDVLASDKHTVILHEARLAKGGRTFTAQYVDVYHLRNGKATEHWHLAVDPKANEEFLAS